MRFNPNSSKKRPKIKCLRMENGLLVDSKWWLCFTVPHVFSMLGGCKALPCTCGYKKSKFPNDFEFSKDEINIGDQNLKAMGLVPNSKIILFCIRDEAYLKKEHSYKDFSYHNYRNWDSDLFVESAECLASKGYSVIDGKKESVIDQEVFWGRPTKKK